MKNVVRLIVLCVLLVAITACNGKPVDQQAQKQSAEQKAAAKDVTAKPELAISFLDGLKKGDKDKMYKAVGLTPELVKSSLDTLIHIKENKAGDAQRVASERVVKISGDVDFFLAKLRKILPESCTVQVTGSGTELTPVKHVVHTVMVTYADKAHTIQDKTGKQVKELKLHLQQFEHEVQGGIVREFTFTSDDYEKMAAKDFEVTSYF